MIFSIFSVIETIHLTTFIAAPVERVFDLARSIDLHLISTKKSKEKAIAGVTSGLINLGETVTWQAKHFFKTRQFTSRISTMIIPSFFTDDMVSGDFTSFRHEHHFMKVENGTIMIDKIFYEVPHGRIGRWFNIIWLKNYLEKLLRVRNIVIKEYSETNRWESVLKSMESVGK
ncbi:MAG: SRPBCC family protein [Chitinophagaceae bacterium]